MDAEALPVYADEGSEDGLTAWVEELASDAKRLGLPLTRMRYNSNLIWVKEHNVTVRMMYKRGADMSANPADDAAAHVLLTQKRIIETFFRLVRLGQGAAVRMFVEKGLVSPDVTDGEGYDNGLGGQFPWPKLEPNDDYREHGDPWAGATPLLAAIDMCRVDMVKLLLSLGADPNALARPPNLRPLSGPKYQRGVDNKYERLVRRTPLMLAASLGNFVVCKLLLQDYHADDAIVAPDGQIALRLAAQARHRDIVELLPARRGGSLQRLGAINAHNMDRIRHAGRNIKWFTKVVVWECPKFVFYDCPVQGIIKPMGKHLRYLWQHRSEILTSVGHFLLHLPQHTWQFVRELGIALVGAAKALGRAILRIPAAMRTMGKWAVEALKTIGLALASIAERTASAIHTALFAISTFFKSVTLQNVLDGFEAVLNAIFITLPAAVLLGVVNFFKYSWRAICYLAGGAAVVVYVLGLLFWTVITFVPKSLWQITKAIGNTIANGTTEVRVWLDPKAI
ncbi:ankyrin repeat-containing protein [Ophiostoma piceae UAMH 11346]|uniref:Ankyrin repeat-containing protein n=1 Tax=Ophiostoma piceae (strain UAMH 11346) TaxID=1262450 RepID=S3CBJ4_OPHP1|nr:ankyrin repeat-containing protein [Ophiostoma piceae UAMH 11346]